ncbi:hypothetical protein D0T53_10465 [Dysgonomonas sp. 216]|uniref:type IX secretion system sortase PorU n=1 Tax=Dysgonomonas sp. 216 TaxID=2302934 RepID=UPI0013D3BEFD|nr:type IX secretion system sortase PorU [Dysgonomonas sp. 216]NDW19332.1 hypothetical protein [Dysgonomonas sp. 216]
MSEKLYKIVNILPAIMVVLFALYTTGAYSQGKSALRYAQNSVLAEGTWYKIKVNETGIYKLTYSDLQRMGISNPANVKVHGYGGWIMDEVFSDENYHDDLPQVAIWMSNARENFGPNDYILFYARGDIKWAYNSTRNEFVHTQNPYSGESYYFITETDAAPLLMDNAQLSSSPTETVTTFTDYALYEDNLVNILESGRHFFGKSFLGLPSQNFNITLPGITSDPALFRVVFIGKTRGGAYMDVSLNNENIDRYSVPSTNYSSYTRAQIVNRTFTKEAKESNVVGMKYGYSSGSDYAINTNFHLDYIRVNYTRHLRPVGGVTLFRNTTYSNNLGYKISAASSHLKVFNVSNALKPQVVNAALSGAELTFAASNLTVNEYAMVDVSKTIPSPTLVGKVDNQNLHALDAAEMVIIVQPILQEYAQQLKELHENIDGMESLVITPDLIYNEFSSGKPDASAFRRFMKMFYDRAEDGVLKAPKYLLLFGDATFDNRFYTEENWTESSKKAIILSYQTDDSSLSASSSYVTDDYFGFLQDKCNSAFNSNPIDLGIGRIPVRTPREAQAVVNKIQNYVANTNKGIWRNKICFVADDAVSDVFNSSETYHAKNAEILSDQVAEQHPHFIVNKVYLDAYERSKTINGFRYPTARSAYLNNLNSGVLIFNYLGHGSSQDWTHEYILTKSEIELMNNDKLPLFITATCDFGRFDGKATSGSELLFTKEKGGGIGVFAASRVVYGSNNQDLNKKLLEHVFDKEAGVPARLGDIMRQAKKGIDDDNKLRFLLIGDPALRLKYPTDEYKISITEVNGKQSDDLDIWMQAQSYNSIKGEIVDADGNLVEDFNGTIESVVFDGKEALETRGYDLSGSGNASAIVKYNDYTNTIYTGKMNVEGGKFNIEFQTPKDILYLNKKGKMSFYAFDKDGVREAQGYFNNYTVGGTDPDTEEELNPPTIHQIYLNHSSFKSGNKVNQTPLFYAEFSDESGINLSSGVGHNISLSIDNVLNYNLTPYYSSGGSSDASGYVRYSIPQLSEGKHKLLFRVWDTWNNSATAELDFEVVSNYKPNIYQFVIDGNPAADYTKFRLLTDVPGSTVNVKYEVFSLTGSILWATEVTGSSGSGDELSYQWDLISNNGKLRPGIYICRATVRTGDGKASSQSEKLIVQ